MKNAIGGEEDMRPEVQVPAFCGACVKKIEGSGKYQKVEQ
jgi:hypothetical protein